MSSSGEPLFLGIDLGTSRLKLQVIDARADPVAKAGAVVAISIPQPGWAEQHPSDGWAAPVTACREHFAE